MFALALRIPSAIAKTALLGTSWWRVTASSGLDPVGEGIELAARGHGLQTLRVTSQIELSAGTVEYEDTGGSGPVVVLLHGLMMNASLCEDVIADLLPQGRLVEVPDSYTLIPLDQPPRLTQVIRDFAGEADESVR